MKLLRFLKSPIFLLLSIGTAPAYAFQPSKATYSPCLKATIIAENAANSDDDKELVRQQLGYLPTNWIRVAARTCSGDPIAIQTYPLQGGSARRQAKAQINNDLGTPFPTLFWFTNPTIGIAIAELERKGYIQRIQESLDPSEQERLLACHEKYAAMRWESMSSSHRQQLIEEPSLRRLRNMLQYSGISGTILPGSKDSDTNNGLPSIKCLHAHYAHFRSCPELDNPVGRRVHQLLQENFPDLEL